MWQDVRTEFGRGPRREHDPLSERRSVFHSIYSASEGNAFDIGFYPAGPGKDEAFDHVGVLDVRCHIHALMHANVVVVDGPYAVVEKIFELVNIAPGDHVIRAWSSAKGMRLWTVRVPTLTARFRLAKPSLNLRFLRCDSAFRSVAAALVCDERSFCR